MSHDLQKILDSIGVKRLLRKQYPKFNAEIYRLTDHEYRMNSGEYLLIDDHSNGDVNLNRKYWSTTETDDPFKCPPPLTKEDTIPGSNRPFVFKFRK